MNWRDSKSVFLWPKRILDQDSPGHQNVRAAVDVNNLLRRVDSPSGIRLMPSNWMNCSDESFIMNHDLTTWQGSLQVWLEFFSKATCPESAVKNLKFAIPSPIAMPSPIAIPSDKESLQASSTDKHLDVYHPDGRLLGNQMSNYFLVKGGQVIRCRQSSGARFTLVDV